MTSIPDFAIDGLTGLFPHLRDRICAVVADPGPEGEGFDDLLSELLEDAQSRLQQAMGANAKKGPPYSSGAVMLSHARYLRLHTATGKEIETEIRSLVDDLNEAQKHKNDPKAMARMLAVAGVPVIVPPVPPDAPPVIDPEELLEDAVTDTMEEAGEELLTDELLLTAEATAGGEAIVAAGAEVIVILLAIIAVLVLIWFMTKPSNCICVAMNLSDAPVSFHKIRKINGSEKNYTITNNLGPVVRIAPPTGQDTKEWQEKLTYVMAGFFAFNRKGGFYGTQYGFSLHHRHRQISFGVECPLNGSNKGWVGIGPSVDHAAKIVDSEGSIYKKAKDGRGEASIRCNSTSGSPAYFIAQIK